MYMKCCLSCFDESFGLCCHFFVAYRVEKCDNKVNTSCCHIFIAYRGEKCDNKSKILKWLTQKEVIPPVEMAKQVAKGSNRVATGQRSIANHIPASFTLMESESDATKKFTVTI